MPVSLAVCETTANVVNAALRESLGVPRAADEAKTGGGDDSSNLQSQIVANAKRVLLAKIEYEEVENYHDSVLENLKSKYVVIKPVVTINNINCNGNNKVGGLNGHENRKQSSAEQTTTPTPTNPNELPKPKRVLYPRENIRIGWKQSERKWQVGTGMINVGNTCYLNSTLQALFHIPALANWLYSEHAHLDNCNVSESNGSCIICAMAKTLQATQSNQSAVRPFLIYSKLKQICKHMIVGRQEDAHEFLRFLVEAMEKAYLMRYRNFKELDQLVKETTPLNQIFGGYLRSEVRCLSCNHVSITFQHFQDLLLDIRKSDTLEEAFDGYFSRERLEDMGYKCEGCKKKVSATKQFSLERAPITLCIQLKRFSMIGNKLTKQITFKPRIDLSRFAARSPTAQAQPLTYRLVSLVTHLGVSQHCGHYTAIGLTESGSYYNFDDSYVRPIAMQSVSNTNAYIMFYELDLGQQPAPPANKLNGIRLANGHQQPVPPATIASPTRFIGPQLPPGGLNGFTNGHHPSSPKTTIQFKPANGLVVAGSGKFQEKSPLVAAATANGKSSSASSNNNKMNQQHYLPMSSDEEDDSNDEGHQVTPQLPSMPRMEDEKPKTKSLVPYESASEEEETAALPAPAAVPPSNPRKRRSGADSSDSEPESSRLNGHANGTIPASNSSSSKQKTDAIDEIFKSLNNFSRKHKSAHSEDDEEDEPRKPLTNGWNNSKHSAPPSPKTPPSPAVIKSKTGIWQITRNDNDHEDDDDEAVAVERPQTPAKIHKNPFATQKPSPSSSSSLEASAKRQKLLNGSTPSKSTTRVGNGYQSEGSTSNGNSTVNELLKQTHRGYGSTSVLSWNGKQTELDKELAAEAREQRQREHNDDEENEMDRGRQRKVKSEATKAHNSSTPGYNPFQEYESQKRWHNNKSSGGGGGFAPRFYHQNFRQNFQQRNKFKYNRFGGPGSAKFQQQRALQRHLAAGGGFTRRPQTTSQQQQQS